MNLDVNWPEFEKQRREEVLKGNYIQLEITIPTTSHEEFLKDGNSPVCHLVQNGSTLFDIAILYKTLDLYMQNLDKKYPDVCKYARETFGVKSMQDVEEEEPNDDI